MIVSTARTPIGKAMRGAFNDLKTPSMTAIAIRAAVEGAGIEPGQIEAPCAGYGHAEWHCGDRPPVRIRPDGHCHRRQADHG